MKASFMRKAVERIKTSLGIEEDIDLHIAGWIVQRIGWGLMLLFLILAATGFFGDGAASVEELVSGETSLSFEKYTRRENDTELEIIASSQNGSIRIGLSPEFNQTFRIERMVPDPRHQGTDNGRIVLDFAASGRAQITLFLKVRKHETGKARSIVTVNDHPFILSQFIYP